MGAVGGEHGGTTRARAAPRAPQYSSRCASSPGAAGAAKATASTEQRRPRGRRDTERSEWRDGRGAANTSDLHGPASGMAGGRGGDLAGQARRAVDQDRPVRQAGPFTRSGKEAGPWSPSTGGPRRRPRVRSTPRRVAPRRPRECCPAAQGERLEEPRAAAAACRATNSIKTTPHRGLALMDPTPIWTKNIFTFR